VSREGGIYEIPSPLVGEGQGEGDVKLFLAFLSDRGDSSELKSTSGGYS